jgi:hypothetical protein
MRPPGLHICASQSPLRTPGLKDISSRDGCVAQARSPWRGWHHRDDQQFKFPPLPGDRDPSSGHALPDLPPHCRYRPGTLSEVLTEHYGHAHPEMLGLASR